MNKVNLLQILLTLAIFVASQFFLFNRHYIYANPSLIPFLKTSSDERAEEGVQTYNSQQDQIASYYHHIPLQELTQSSPQSKPLCEKLTIAVDDRILQNSTRQTGYNIPRIIHQTSRTRCVVKEFSDSANKWKATLDGWEYYFHDDEAMARLINNLHPAFPTLPLVWNSCVTQGAMKADLWRMMVLWEYGGIFADLDSPPSHLTAQTIQPDDDAIFVVDKDSTASFHFMAMAPKHPLAFLTLEMAIMKLVTFNRQGKIKPRGRMNPVRLTGPSALRSAINLDLKLGNETTHKEGSLMAGTYRSGINSKSFRILQNLDNNVDYWVVRDSHGQGRKSKFYEAMNMTHFSSDLKYKSQLMSTSCALAVMKDLEKEKKNADYYQPLPLTELTQLPSTKCSADGSTVLIENRMATPKNASNKYRIPRTIHLTHPTRCMSLKEKATSVDLWAARFFDWDLFLHDDEAMNRFVVQNSHPAFSKLKMVYQLCSVHRSVKAALWQLLVLWEYGGVVVSNTAVPNRLMSDMIQSDDDAVVILHINDAQHQQKGDNAYSYSMDFMAIAPKHPLIYFALQLAVFNLIVKDNRNTTCQSIVTQQQGIHAALQEGISRFLNIHPNTFLTSIEDSKGKKMVGQDNRHVRILKNIDPTFWVAVNNETAVNRCLDGNADGSKQVTVNCILILLNNL